MTDPEIARRRYRQLQRTARVQDRPTWELLELYALEGFLARLAISPHRVDLVLKGGMLLAAFDIRRPTRDVDLQAEKIPNDVGVIRNLVADITGIELSDGLHYDTAEIQAELIREEDPYAGVRVSAPARLATGRMRLQVDVSVGDPIRPPAADIELPRILEGDPIPLRGYPVPMVLAEKVVTALQWGTANTRWRDFADIHLLSDRHVVDGTQLQQALTAVGEHRATGLTPLSEVLAGFPEIAQERWERWRAERLTGLLSVDFGELLERVSAFADPALAGQVSDWVWNPDARAWEHTEPTSA